MIQVFPAKSILSIDGEFLSEHSRQPMQVEIQKIQSSNRTVNGTMRFYEIARKHRLDVSWENLPSQSSGTVDGFAGGIDMMEMYNSGGAKQVAVWSDLSAAKTNSSPMISFDGLIQSFNFTVVKRNIGSAFYDFWDISMSIEEI